MDKEFLNIARLPRKILMFFLIVFIILAIGSVGFMELKGVSFSGALFMTLQSMAFMFSDEMGIAKGLQVFLAIIGIVVVGWILQSLLNILFEGHLSEYLKAREFISNIRKMRKHYIIAGGGRVGEEIAINLKKNKKQYIIIEKDEVKVSKLKKKGFIVVQGDVADADSSDLIEAGIKSAKVIVLAMPETEKNLIVTMCAKELNPDIEVYARADNPAFVGKLKKAGAKVVIVPEVAAADQFSEAIL